MEGVLVVEAPLAGLALVLAVRSRREAAATGADLEAQGARLHMSPNQAALAVTGAMPARS